MMLHWFIKKKANTSSITIVFGGATMMMIYLMIFAVTAPAIVGAALLYYPHDIASISSGRSRSRSHHQRYYKGGGAAAADQRSIIHSSLSSSSSSSSATTASSGCSANGGTTVTNSKSRLMMMLPTTASATTTTTIRWSMRSTTAATSTTTTTLHMVGGLGWDNDNFLDALSKGPEAQRLANEEYYALSRFGRRGPPDSEDDNDSNVDNSDARLPLVPPVSDDTIPTGNDGVVGAQLTEEMKAKIKASHTEDEARAQGGQMYQKLLERAQQIQPPPPSQQQPPMVPSLPLTPPSTMMSNLSIEEQARLYREAMLLQEQQQLLLQQQQQQQQQLMYPPPLPLPPQDQQQSSSSPFYMSSPLQPPVTMPLPPVPPSQARDGGRRVGRNRDADAIVNSSDVYFAQLKRDSSLRNIARYTGDMEKANQPFSDPSIQDIKLHTNPYIEEARQREQALLETTMDEMLLPSQWASAASAATGGVNPDKPVDKSYAGVSFKQLLQQKQQGKQQPQQQRGTSESNRSSTRNQPQPPPLPLASSSLSSDTLNREESAICSTARKTDTTATKTMNPSTSSASSSTNDLRTQIRTMMGLLLKHRGGPGFGSGRLQGPELERFVQLTNDVMFQLREETTEQAATMTPSSSRSSSSSSLVTPSPTTELSYGAPIQSSSIVGSTNSVVASAGGSGVVLHAQPIRNRIESMLSCVEGAIQMYRNCPPTLQGSILVTFRAALVSAASTCNELIGSDGDTSSGSWGRSGSASDSSLSANQQMDQMMQLIQGAIQMYRNCPPELQKTVLVTVRAALLSAIQTCNGILSGTGQDAFEIRSTASSNSNPTQSMTQFYDVDVDRDEGSINPTSSMVNSAQFKESWSGEDANTRVLEDIYERLTKVAGDGTMGIRSDLSPSDANQVAMDLADLRVLLVDELSNGIPPPDSFN